MPARRLSKLKLAGFLGGFALTALTGAFLTWTEGGAGLSEWSYDLPYFLRGNVEVPDVVIVYLDRESQETLGQPDGPWDRALHVKLIKRLAQEAATRIFYDIVFDTERNPEIDRELAEVIRTQGQVILGSRFVDLPHLTSVNVAAVTQVLRRPIPILEEAAREVGLVMLSRERIQRRIFAGTPEMESAVWVAARLAGAPVTRDDSRRLADRWLNFYGPAYQFRAVNLAEALATNGVPPGFFRGKTVFVGGHPDAFHDEQFATPYNRFVKGGDKPFHQATTTRFDHAYSSGVEVQATAFLNLTRGEWLERIALPWQLLFVLAAGLLLGGLVFLRPWQAAGLAFVFVLTVTGISLYLNFYHRLWWSWLVPVAVQAPVALVWSVGFQYAVEGRKRRQLHRAFSAYLSPHLAERIAEQDFDLVPGGKEVEATILFTDLEGFTALSEKLPPGEVSRLLIAYFDEATRHILEHDGMVSKYVGDGVMAMWGTALPDPNQAERAVLAACGIIEAGRKEIGGRRLRTRIGINTGPALAGNLGSYLRFDYTAIGATTNLASRLEKLNQALGTNILITEATRRQLSERIEVRALGRFLVKGITEPFRVFEVLGTTTDFPRLPEWVGVFERARELMEAQDWEQAEGLFQQVIALRGGQDGPSQFLLKRLAAWRSKEAGDEPWDGVTRMSE